MDPVQQHWWRQSISTKNRYVDVDPDPSRHDQRVLLLINKYLDQNSSAHNTVSGNLGDAVSAVVKDRETSVDLVDMPDVSYYLQARYEVSKEPHAGMQIVYAHGGIALTYFYNLLKIPIVPFNRAAGSHVLESRKGVPNSPATLSAILWVKRGAYDGFNDVGEQRGRPPMHPSWPRDFAFGL